MVGNLPAPAGLKMRVLRRTPSLIGILITPLSSLYAEGLNAEGLVLLAAASAYRDRAKLSAHTRSANGTPLLINTSSFKLPHSATLPNTARPRVPRNETR